MTKTPINCFRLAHEPLEALLRAHLLAVIEGDFNRAVGLLAQWREQLDAHIRIEETLLLPWIPNDARWPARVYLLEHQRIVLLAGEYATLAQAASRHVPASDAARCALALDLLDAAHALRHLLEHHHQREEQALACELPEPMLRAAFGVPNGA